MGVFKGGQSYRQYYVTDPLPEGFRERFAKRILHDAHQEIAVGGDEERSVGWCNAAFPLDVALPQDTWLFNNYVVLGMRVDTLVVPGSLLRLYTELEVRRIAEEQQRPALNRYERAEIQARVKRELRRKTMPAIKCVDMAWNLDQGVARFWSSGERLNLEFVELFEQTFEQSPIPDGPYTACRFGGLGLEEADLAALETVEPDLLVEEAVLRAAAGEGG